MIIKEVFAAEHELGGIVEGSGPLGESWKFVAWGQDYTINTFSKVISLFVGVLTVAAGLWFIFQFFIGAFGWITAGSDKASMEAARKRLTNSVVGLIIVIAAIFLINLIGKIIGLEILNPGKYLLGIWQ